MLSTTDSRITPGTVAFQGHASASPIEAVSKLDEIHTIFLSDLMINGFDGRDIRVEDDNLEILNCVVSPSATLKSPHIAKLVVNAFSPDSNLWPTVGNIANAITENEYQQFKRKLEAVDVFADVTAIVKDDDLIESQ